MIYEEQVMKRHEQAWEQHLPPGSWIVARLDGRGFSAFTEHHYQKPFDFDFHTAMVYTARYLLEAFYGCYVYVASDEISILFSPSWNNFDRRVQKTTTLLASDTSVFFTKQTGHAATFDARVLSLSSPEEVAMYFEWRLDDVKRCALQTATYWALRKEGNMSGKQASRKLDRLTVYEKRLLLREYGIEYDNLPGWQRKGSGFYWEEYEKQGYNPITQQIVWATRKRIAHYDGLARGTYEKWLLGYLEPLTVADPRA